MSEEKSKKVEVDLNSFVGVRLGLAAAIREAGFDTPRDLWNHIQSLEWPSQQKENFINTLGLYQFVMIVYGFGRIEVKSKQNKAYLGSHNDYTFWSDLIASVLGLDTEDLFGIPDRSITFEGPTKFAYSISILFKDAEGYFFLGSPLKEDWLTAIKHHAREVDGWTGLLRREDLDSSICDNAGLLVRDDDISYRISNPERKELRSIIEKELASFSPRRQNVVRWRLGFNQSARGCDGLIYEKIGDNLGMTRKSTRQNFKIALQKLRSKLKDFSPV
jgi:hypothetical protein